MEALGHECAVVENGEQAWQQLTESGADVLITDWMMPGLDGLELCRRIRAEANGTYTYLIVATSMGERENVLAGMHAGADDYLTKPIDPFDLEARLIAAERVTSLHAQLSRYRAELVRVACTDPLTQLRNRLSLTDHLSELHARSERYGRPYCLIMCDVDLFKIYNDTYGHQAGDRALQAIASVLSKEARMGDDVYRYGGEEFLLLLPEQSSSSAAVLAERLRQMVEALGMDRHGGAPGRAITISLGIAEFRPSNRTSSEELLNSADAALYQAKVEGRNRVVLASSASS
ncbi:MAG: diguanylate cyclase [Acidimicrobiales bacterium]